MTHTAGYSQGTDRQAGPLLQPARGLPADVSLSREIRRRQARFGSGAIRVQSPVFGAAVEISVGGLRLESVVPLVVGGNYIFRLNYGTCFLNLPGRVAWCRPHRIEITERGGRTIYQTGIELRPGEPDPGWRATLANRAGVAVGV